MKYSPPLSPAAGNVPDNGLARATSIEAEAAIGRNQGPVDAPRLGLVFALHSGVDGPVAGLAAGGIPIIRRQIRQLHALGVQGVVVVTVPGQIAAVDHARREARRNSMALELAESADQLVRALDGKAALAIDEGVLVDERMLAAFFATDAGAAAAGPAIAMRDAAGTLPAGLALIPAGTLDETAAASLFAEALCGLPRHHAAVRDLSVLDTYAPGRRRHLPMVWLRLNDRADGARGTRLLLDSAQKGCLDWPARFIHPPIENLLTRLLLPTPITPNQLSVFIFFLGLYAAWCFATGSWALALALALIIGPLDGVDGKLARTRMEFSRWGDLEHVGDKIVEYLCYVGMAVWIAAGWAWAVCSLIVLFAFAEAIQGEFYRRLTGGQLDDAGGIERRFRLVSGRRNTFMWTLIPFVSLGAWNGGFVMIALYSVVTFFFMQWRFFVRLGEVASRSSPVIADNMRRTAYAFLKKGN